MSFLLHHSVEELLQICRKEKTIPGALQCYVHICNAGLDSQSAASAFVVSMLMDVGCVWYAQQAFEKAAFKGEIPWSVLIMGYVRNGYSHLALKLYQKNAEKDDPFYASGPAFVALLKACCCEVEGGVEMGHVLHAEIARKGLLEKDIFVGSTLVDMYSKCGSVKKSQEVFDGLSIHNVVSWTILIGAYVEHGLYEKSLVSLEKMHQEGVSPNVLTLIFALKACGCLKSIERGNHIYDVLVRIGLERELLVGNALIDMYCKCGSLGEANEVFRHLSSKDVVTWTALIAGFSELGEAKAAIHLLEQMEFDGIPPNSITFVCILKGCGSVNAIVKGQEIHADIVGKGMETEQVLGSAVVDMYIKCSFLIEAHQVFESLPICDVVSWTSLVIGYTEHRYGEEALQCLEAMNRCGVPLNMVTYMSALKACGTIKAMKKGQEIYADVIRKGFESEHIDNTLIHMYVEFNLLETAQAIFEKICVRDSVSWNILTSGYAEHGLFEEVVHCFERMQHEGTLPHVAMYVHSLKACGSIGDDRKGQEIHHQAMMNGLDRELPVSDALVDMYAKLSCLPEAQNVFDRLVVRDNVSWTTLIAAYSEHGYGTDALLYMEQMKQEGFIVNAITLICALKACPSMHSTQKMEEIHAEIIKKGFEEVSVVAITLVDIYAKCGFLLEACELFDKLSSHDVVSGTTLITSYIEHGCWEKALECFQQMQKMGSSLNSLTYACGLKACGTIGGMREGQEIHSEVVKKGFEIEIQSSNVLIDMYAKCGFHAEAQDVFDKLWGSGDVISWNAIMAGYSQLGETEIVLDFFHKMVGNDHVKPNSVTFLSVLNACSDGGLVDIAHMLFVSMRNVFGLIQTLDHFTCMIDLLGRASHIDEVVSTIEKMPFHPGIVAWHSVLGACKKWGNVDLAKHAFEYALCLDDQSLAPYIFMSNIYSDCNVYKQAKANEVYE